MLPDGADAVVMVENTQQSLESEIEVLRSVAVGENVIAVGEDVAAGQVVIPQGMRIRPAEIGGLMAIGVTNVAVARRPKAAILSSGDEVVHPGEQPRPGQVRDINSYSLSAMVEASGGLPVRYGIIADSMDELHKGARRALEECDMLVITAGSSVSARDITARVIDQLGAPGVLVHGVNVRPGKPTILAVCGGKPVVGLPGNPVSALVISSLFVEPVIGKLLGLRRQAPKAAIPARLSLNLSSQSGREEYIAVRLIKEGPEDGPYTAEPVFGKSNLIFTLTRADGLVCVPPDASGLSAGESVEVILL
jgi:molybdopterin molybdotransferase